MENQTLQTEKTLTRLIRTELEYHPAIEEYIVEHDKTKILNHTIFWTLLTIVILILGM